MQLYTAEDSRQCDKLIISGGTLGFTLMERAAKKVFDALMDLQDEMPLPVVVLVGAGNNGGDGLLVAALIRAEGQQVTAVSLKPLDMHSDDGKQALEVARAQGVNLQLYDANFDFNDCMVIDALYGTGLNRPLSAVEQAFVRRVNQANNTVLAVDIPSGLCADTGFIEGAAIEANKTISFIVRKRGLFTANGPDCSGKRYFFDLMSSDEAEKQRYQQTLLKLSEPVDVLSLDILKQQIPRRKKNTHKGCFGHCVLIGGNYTMVGAIVLAAEACLRVGTGLVTVVTRPSNQTAIQAQLPEVMTAVTQDEIEHVLAQATSIAIGPGLGEDNWAKALLAKVLHVGKPLVADASALNILADDEKLTRQSSWVLTPHPKEAARLLGISSSGGVQKDRFTALSALIKKMNAVVVLKGCGSLVSEGNKVSLSLSGNAGMSVAGVGDVLTGVIGGLLAQGYPAFFSAQLGVELHACAGDKAVEQSGEIGLLARELMPLIRGLMNT